MRLGGDAAPFGEADVGRELVSCDFLRFVISETEMLSKVLLATLACAAVPVPRETGSLRVRGLAACMEADMVCYASMPNPCLHVVRVQ